FTILSLVGTIYLWFLDVRRHTGENYKLTKMNVIVHLYVWILSSKASGLSDAGWI
ncbi:hypothetical protein ACJX0J_039074, partial [Zea mays]